MRNKKDVFFNVALGIIFFTCITSIVISIVALTKNLNEVFSVLTKFGFIEFSMILLTAIIWFIIDDSIDIPFYTDNGDQFEKILELYKNDSEK